MGLSEDYKQRIKKSMDMDEGGRLHAIADKAAAIDAPVLIIGLGGSGVDSLLVTKKMIYDTIAREQREDGTLSDKPKNIEYLGIDTDDASKTNSHQGIRLNENNGEIKIYTMPNVPPVLANPSQLPDYISKWLDTSIKNDAVINGAGAVRQLGRLLLMQNISGVISVLKEKIDRVTLGFDPAVPLYVFIIAGISGGTGSGTFIDIPYIVRAVSGNISLTRPVQNIGLLYLPDVNAERKCVDESKRSSLYANGFASLKELDYLMNIEHVGDMFEQTYGSLKVGSRNGRPVKPYDICLLLSSKDQNGARPATGDESYELVTHVVAETIFNFVLGDDGAEDLSSFSIFSWLSNESNNSRIYKTNLGDHRHPISYVYSIAGASSARLPMDDIMSYLAYKMYQEVQNFWDQRPSDQDIDAVEKYFHLAQNTIVADAQKRLPKVNTEAFTVKDVTENHAGIVQTYELTLRKQKVQIVENLNAMLGKLNERLADSGNIVNQYFKDLEKGPVFAQQCLFTSSPDHRSAITDLRKYRLAFAQKIKTPDEMVGLDQQVAAARQDVVSAFLSAFLGRKGGKLKKYIQKMNQLYQAKLEAYLFEQLQTFCQNADGALTDRNNEIFDVVSDLLRQMMPIFEKYGKIKTQATTTTDAAGTTLSWTMVDTPKFIRDLEERMNNNPEFSVNLRQVVQNFYSYLFEHIDVWKDEKQDAVEEINTFIYRQFGVILNNTMDFFLGIIASSEGKTLSKYCEDLFKELTQKAKVRYPIDSAFATGAVTQPGYSFISVPNNSPQLLKAARQAASATTTVGGEASFVKASGIRDRIFMMNFMSATPLSLNQDIRQFYEVYKQHRDTLEGLHLYVPTRVGNQVSDTDWRNLPSPYPESEWVDFEDSKEKKTNNEYRSILQKALEYGYVTEDVLNRKLTLYYGTTVDLKAIAQDCGIRLYADSNGGGQQAFDDSTIQSNAAQVFIQKVGSQLTPEAIRHRCGNQLGRTGMVLDANGTLKKSYEEMIFIQMYRPRDEIAQMVKNHEAALAALENVKSRVVDDQVVDLFVKCRIAAQVNRHPKKLGAYVYFDRSDAAHELLTLTGRQTEYPEYYILKAFMKLPQQARDVLKLRAENALNNSADREQDAAHLQTYRDNVLKKKIEDLNWKYADIEDGEKILDSYNILLAAADRLEEQLNPQGGLF